MEKPFALVVKTEFSKPCILMMIEDERRRKGLPAMSNQSLTLLSDSLKVVFKQVQDTFNQITLCPDTCLHFYTIFTEIIKCICMYSPSYKAELLNRISSNRKNVCFKFQTTNLYQFIQIIFRDYYYSLTSVKQDKDISEIYLILNELLNQNAHTANFFYKKANFRCIEMIVKTLKNGY